MMTSVYFNNIQISNKVMRSIYYDMNSQGSGKSVANPHKFNFKDSLKLMFTKKEENLTRRQQLLMKAQKRLHDDLNLPRLVQSIYKIKACLTVLVGHHHKNHDCSVLDQIQKEFFRLTNLEHKELDENLQGIKAFLQRDEKKQLYRPEYQKSLVSRISINLRDKIRR